MWQRTVLSAMIYDHCNLKRYVIYGCDEISEEMYKGGMDVDGEMFPTFGRMDENYGCIDLQTFW